jgi:hypothetical protein
MLRISIAAAVVAGGVLSVATPALAADPSLTLSPAGSTTLKPGASSELDFTVNGGTLGGTFTITVASSFGNDVVLRYSGQNCGSTCTIPNQTFAASDGNGDSKTYAVTLTAAASPNVAAGQSESGSIKVTVDPGGAGNTFSKTQSYTVQGPTAAASPTASTVTQVSGVIKDTATGQPIAAATVSMLDGASHQCSTATTSAGAFSFKTCNNAGIGPGEIAIHVDKDGYATLNKSINGVAGQSLTVTLVMVSSASPTVSAADSVAPISGAPSDAGGTILPQNTATTNASGTGGGTSMLIIVGGILLVLVGIGAIAFILWKRKKDDRGDDGDDDDAPDGGPTPVPAARGNFRDGANETQLLRSGGYGGPAGNPDAPTMLHNQPVVDEYPDPYGAPLPPPRGAQPGYGAPTQVGGYGQADQYGAPTQTGGYGQGGGYGGNGYHEQQAGGYVPSQRPPSDPYVSPAQQDYGNGYGSEGGYGAGQQEYGSPYNDATAPAQQGGYDSTRRYEAGDYDQGGYDQSADSGYSQQRGGHDQQRGGYDAAGEPGYGSGAGGGYGAGADHGQRGGYGGGPSSGAGGYSATPASGAGGGYGGNNGYDPAQGGYGGHGNGYGGAAGQGGGQPPGDGYESGNGYDQQRGGYRSQHDEPYDRRGGPDSGRHGGGSSEQRPPLDWLDS